ncbi:MAG: Trp biosynthesis-associated membrane protein [Nocardioides sp.]|nr:Trp biosynthesis-associated membrane protein [Nocardioidaceae bacterium]MCB8958465.1 Trp biosynthesis-associated membrane protein [Nocardioides sp.]
MAERPGPRRTFGPVVLLGLAAAGLTAVAGNHAVVASDASSPLVTYDAHVPLATSLGLVVLACWGVVLVTRGLVRRAVAVLGVLASLGALVTVVLAWSQVSDRYASELAQVGVTGASTSPTVWYWLALLGAALSVGATALAVLLAPAWPEMGSRYDAPGTGAAPDPAAARPPEDQSSLDLWKAIDEGRDPTAPDHE